MTAPFTYPAVPDVRRHGPHGYADLDGYRPWVRDEFAFRCIIQPDLECKMTTAILRKIKLVESLKAKYVAMPTEAAVAQAEASLGITFPVTYREFVLKFGAGTLAGSFRVFAPLPKTYKFQGTPVYDLVAEHTLVASTLPSYRMKKRKSDWVLFCVDEGGGMYLWNRLEPDRTAGCDFRIYQAIHPDEIYSFADTFKDFVERCCTSGSSSELNQDEEDLEENWTFARFQVPPRH